MAKPSLPPPFPSPLHRGLGEAAYAMSLALPELSPGDIIVAGTLGGEARRIASGRATCIEELDVLAEEAQRLHWRTGQRAAKDLHQAIVALSVEVERASAPAPAGYVPSGRRGSSGL